MNIEDWKKGIEDLKKVGLKETEKAALFERVINRSPYKPIISPFSKSWNFVARNYATVVSSALIFVLAGSISAAAENSIPGNILYPVKINITEPMRDLVKTTPEESAIWQIEKVNRRIEEAEILAAQQRLDSDKREQIQKLFEKSFSEFDDSIKKFEASSTKEKIEIELEKRLEVHSKVVNKVQTKKNDKNDQNELKKFEQDVVSVVKEAKEEKVETEETDDREDEEYQKDIEKMVEKRIKQLEKERERIEKKYQNREENRDNYTNPKNKRREKD